MADHFVASMKGVILGIAPRAQIVDVTHAVCPFDVGEAAFTLAQAWRWFPKGTIHVAVVDPGVGTARRPILVEAGGHRFIGPDNGLFSMIYDAGVFKAREISNAKLGLAQVSRTFHGRDVFAPAAAHLAKGVTAARFGKRVDDVVRMPHLSPRAIKRGRWAGTILKVDRFGNLITNFHVDQSPDVRTKAFELVVGTETVRRLALTYAETAVGEVAAIVGSSGYLEVSANQASAAEKLGCGAGASVELEIF
jgi:S-adenosylmethionine hydrolase